LIASVARIYGVPARLCVPGGRVLRPALFRQDLIVLFNLLQQREIKPLIAQRFPLAEARRAHEGLGKGGVIGKIVLVLNGASR
jgi:NADPH:quinone reductase